MATIAMHPRFPLRSTLALAAAVLVTAGISPGVQAAGDKGRLRLAVGAAGQFTFQMPDYAPGTTTIVGYLDTDLVQTFGADGPGSCLIKWSDTTSGLVVLEAGGGVKSTTPGFGPTSIGAWDGPKGTPCSRVSRSVNESLTFWLGRDSEGKPTGHFFFNTQKINAFDRLVLDLEVKSDAHVVLITSLAGVPTGEFHLRTGGSVNGLDTTNGNPWSTPAAPNANCSARSDSGPDSGPSDNCRWTIDGIIGNEFTIYPEMGEFSLEGGGDWFGEVAKNSLIYLTYVEEGDLRCGLPTSTISIGDYPLATANCQVIGPPRNLDGTCGYSTIHYFFRDVTGSFQGCDFMKVSGASVQMAAAMNVKFPPEPRVSRLDLATTKQTRVLFPQTDGSYKEFTPDLCRGTLVTDPTNPGSVTIKEVLQGGFPAGVVVDQVDNGEGIIDWACVLKENVEYLGKQDAQDKLQVQQTILFWGDPLGVRW